MYLQCQNFLVTSKDLQQEYVDFCLGGGGAVIPTLSATHRWISNSEPVETICAALSTAF
jgi:hypothetical protein